MPAPGMGAPAGCRALAWALAALLLVQKAGPAQQGHPAAGALSLRQEKLCARGKPLGDGMGVGAGGCTFSTLPFENGLGYEGSPHGGSEIPPGNRAAMEPTETQGNTELSWASAEAAADGQREAVAQHMIFIPPITVFPTMSPANPAHNGRVCSTWGDFHYKTFDGDIFRFPGLCNYVFSAHCGAAYEDFNIQLRRSLASSRPTITHVVLKTQGLVVEISNGSVLINGQREDLPYSRAGLVVEQTSVYVKVNVRLALTFTWNGEDSALLELDPKYANQTCGLCGDFNGLPAINEFYAHNARLTPVQFGNLQKLDGPMEQCQDPLPSPADNCTDEEGICRRTLLGPAFAQCNGLVDADVYVAACTQDLCRCPTCPCATFAEYSRQCAHAGGQPQNWRGPDFCPQMCPLSLQHQECGSPCADTCSNPEHSQLCEDHCVDGCFCPPGTVLDDVTHTGCLPLERCSCTHSGRIYAPGASFTTSCSSCTCSRGLWQCQDLPCPGTCSVQGGSHISTYDEKLYDVHGDCSYILSKKCADSSFTVLAELRKCGLTDNENCLKTVTLRMTGSGDTAIQIQANGGVFMNSIYTQLPVSAANITIFRPSSFFILVQTGLGLQLQVQLVPLMQVYLRLDPSYRGQMCGLCGNFNQNQADDFRILGGVVEGTAAPFANTWKTQAACPNVKNSFEDPCSLSVENENYAQHWCSLLTHPAGAFSPCHTIVNPAPFHSNCMFDTCNCEKSEACMCAALSSYVRACAAKGVLLRGWRDDVCTKYMSSCPKSQTYAYVVDGCQPTCRSLSQADVTCGIAFVPVDGCTCPSGTFLDDAGACVPAEACPCYFRGSVVAPGEVVHDDGVVCSCVSGKLSCLGAEEETSTGCVAPMVYLDCRNASAGTPGAECLRSCHMLDVDCFSTHCVSGCVCPPGLVSDGSGGCVAEEDCPCLHNEATYKPGETIRVDCNTCTCRSRRWECSHRPCLGTCVAYGDGHFITFDGERYSFEGSCEYTLAQDHCGGNGTTNGTFHIISENVPCGTTGVTCSKAIKLFLENYELILHEGTYKVVQRGSGGDPPYKIRYMGIYLTVETRSGMVVSWDRKTSVFIRLRQDYKGRVCGLCGNFDDNAVNDFTTRSQSVVGNALEFGNSWKFSPSCPDASAPKDPCTANPYRKSWAQKQCSIINSATFAACRSQVDSTKYYEACVSDACACNSGGDCECFCTVVAAYAQACRDVGVCVTWRTPDICPLFCDYYNPRGECEWHYEPCGAPCLRTCRNPSGHCLLDLPGLEGCYPRCPPSKPFFSEDQMECVAQCGCYDEDGNYHEVGSRVPTAENCQSCDCTPGGLQCTYSLTACTCTYEGKTYGYGDVIYNTTDGLGACLTAICGNNGTIIRRVVECPGTVSTTPFTFTTTAAPLSTTGPAPTISTVCVHKQCHWSDWYDSGRPEPGMGGGDFETFVNLRQRGHQVCPAPEGVECRAQQLPDKPLQELGQKVECDMARGLTCLNSEQSPPLCHNYELRVLCCDYMPCGTSPALGTSPSPSPGSTTWVSTLKSLPTPTQTTSTRESPLGSTAASTSQTPPAMPATTETQEVGSSSTPAATTCQPKCQWTGWFDEDYPKSEKAGGDIESYDRIRSAGGAVCERPQEIECRAVLLPSMRLEDLGQRVHCDPRFGLVCRNEEQEGVFKMCFNYKIRMLCCSDSHCGEAASTSTATTAATATSTATTAATATSTATSSPGVTTVVPFLSTRSTSQATSLNPSHTATHRTSATRSLTAPPGSTKPTTPERATSVLPTRTTLQGTTGGTSQGPTSRAHATTGAPASTASTISTSPPPTSRTKTSTSGAETPTGTLVPTATTEANTNQGTTSCQPKCEWTEWFDVDFPTSGVTGGDMETYDNIRAAGGRMCAEPKSIECRAENYPEVSIDRIGQVVSCSLQAGLVCRNEDQQGNFNMCFNYNIRVLCCDYGHCPSTPATTTVTPPGTTLGLTSPTASGTNAQSMTTPSPSTGPSTVTSGCQLSCHWTNWLDSDQPFPGYNGGDIETYYHIVGAGGQLCLEPVAIECEAVLYPEIPLGQLGQVVQCNVDYGLICRNSWQSGGQTCLNYHIRVRCCPSSPWTTPRVFTTLTSRASLSTTEKVTVPTPVTGTFSPKTTKVTVPSTETGPSSPGITQSLPVTTTMTGPSTARTPQGVIMPTTATGPSSPGTKQRLSIPTSVTGPSSPGTTHRVPTTQTPLTFLSTTEKVTVPSPVTGPFSPGTTQRVSISTTETRSSSPGTTQRVSIPIPVTGPSSPGTTQRVSIATTGTGPSTPGTTQRVSIPTTVTGPSTPETTHWVPTTQTPLTSLSTTEKVTVPISQTRPFSPKTTEVTVPIPVTGPSSPGTTQGVSISNTETGPPSPGTTQRVSIPTTATGPSTPGTTQRVSIATTATGPSTSGTTQRVSTPTSATGPSTPGTTQRVSIATTATGPSTPGTTQRVSIATTATGPSTPGTTQRVSIPTTVPGPSSPGTTHRVPTTQSPLTSLSTMEKVTVPTSQTGPFSPKTTKVTVLTTETGPSSPRISQSSSISTTATGPSIPGTTQRVSMSTPVTGPSSPGTTQKYSISTTETGPSSPGTTQRVSIPTPVTGPSSPGSNQRVSISTTGTRPSSPRTTEETIPTPVTGPSTPRTTQQVSIPTSVTGLSSPGSTQRVSIATSVTGPSSPRTTQRLSMTTSVTGPSSPGITHRVDTTQTPLASHSTTEKVTLNITETGPSSPGTTQRLSITTSVTGHSSPGTTHRVATTQTPLASLSTTEKVTVPTSVTGPSSPGTTQRYSISTTGTGLSSPRTTQRVSISTTETGPSSPGTSQRVSTPTSDTGPSTTGTTQTVSIPTPLAGHSSPGTAYRVPTTQKLLTSLSTTEKVTLHITETGPSSPGTTERLSIPTSATGPSSPGTTHRVATTQTPLASHSTTEKGTVPTPVRGPSSPGTTQRYSISTTGTGASSPRTTHSVPTIQTPLTSFSTTEKVTLPTSQTGPFSPKTTEVTVPTTETGPTSPGITQSFSITTTVTGSSTHRTTQRVSIPTAVTGPTSPGITHRTPTTQTPLTSLSTTEKVTLHITETGPSSPGTTQRLSITTSVTGPFSPGTTHRVPTTQTPLTSLSTTEKFTVPTPVTGPSSPVTTQRYSISTTGTGPSSPGTTHTVSTIQTPLNSLSTTEKVTVPTSQTGPFSPKTTEVTVPTTETGPSSPGTTQSSSITTTVTGPSTPRTTQKYSIYTPETGPSSPGTTQRVSIPTTVTGSSSSGTTYRVAPTQKPLTSVSTTEKVTLPITETGPSSPSTTQRLSITTSVTGPSSPGITQSFSIPTTVTGPSTPRTTQRVSIPTTETGPSSPRTTHSVPTIQTPLTSLGTTEKVTLPTSQTGPFSPKTTEVTVPTTETGPSSTGITQSFSITTTVTGPSTPRTTQRVSIPTPKTGSSSSGTTQRISIPTTVTGPTSPGITHRIPTTQTTLTSLSTTEKVTVPTPVTGPSSPVTTQRYSSSTTGTGPSSPGTTHTVSTIQTPLNSLSTTEKVTVPTSQTGPFSPKTTEVTVPTTETRPSSPGTTQSSSITTAVSGPSTPRTTQRYSIYTPETGLSSPGTTQSVSIPTTVTGSSSPGTTYRLPSTQKPLTSLSTTEKVTLPITETGSSSPGTTQRLSITTSVTGPSSPWTTHRVPTTQTPLASHSTTEKVTVPTPVTGPSSPGTTQPFSISTTETGPSSPGITQSFSIPTTVTGPSTPRTTQRVSIPTTETGPSSPGTTQRVPTTQTPLTSHSTTEKVTVPTPVTGPSSPGTTQLYSISITGTGLSSPGTTQRLSIPTPETSPSSPGTTHRVPTTQTPLTSLSTTEKITVPTSQTGPFSPGTTEVTVPTTVARPFSSRTTEVTLPTSVTGPSSPGTTRRVPTTQTPLASLSTTEKVTVPTTVTGPSSSGTTERVSVTSPSSPLGTQTTTVKPGTPSVSPAASLVTSRIWTTPAISSSLPQFSVSTTAPSILTTLRPTAFSSPPISTTACFCQAFGRLFLPGDIIYNKTDSAGCQFYAICNQHCDIDRFPGACPTSSPLETSKTPAPPTSQPPGCDLIFPPRQVNESWTLEDCTVARCEGKNRIILLGPQPVANITCVNGHLPVKVWNEKERCAYRLECECSCSGWGDSHYTTFDGTSYSFWDNCTHVLMREIRPRDGNLSIYINNYYCGAAAATAHCPRALIVHYESMKIILTTTTGANGQEKSLILFDQRPVGEGFSKNGVNVSVTGTTMMRIDIPAIGVSVTFDGRVFQAQLSYSHFNHNTEGLCGTCTNSQTDDCRRSDGTVAPTCKDMASSWLIPDSSKESCRAAPLPTSPPPSTRTMSASTTCPPAPLCTLMLSQVFAECHGLIPPGPFFSTCISDHCQASDPCQSLEAYAVLCRARGVCSDWRNATGGLCELTCPPAKVYKPCGPAQAESCDSRSQSPVNKRLAEGCFCPDGHILFNSYTDVCVPQCSCVGPDGFPKLPGERWVSNCQDCVCDKDSVSVQCVPVQCKAQDQPPQCSQAGFVTVTRPLADNPCCQETLCVCNVTTCPRRPPTCGPKEELTSTQNEGDCCPTFHCRPKLCTYNGTFYGVGATFPGVKPCHTCTCLSTDTQNLTVQCEENACNTPCPQGFEHSKVVGQCCGECVQTACLTPDGRLVQPNETWVSSPVDNCTEYRCQETNGLHVLILRPAPCPEVSSCMGVLRKSGCCYSCEEELHSCRVRVNRTVLRLGDCTSGAPVNVSSCEGSCPGVSAYSLEAQAMQRRCTCCQETRAHEEAVTLQCPNGTAVQHTYIHVDACSCTPSCAPSPEASTPIHLL
ncbi:PREDICTED: mucin-5B [Ceratotherium simum simum]|uniref:Mucin-5B n=1 Tax=Ceratotherium simum simum TaxID=73337 RepID=A0ABM1DHD3_CERSS|nr:PREDICTED: mucin-5B [Ceratotherium simum simum]